MNKILLYFIAIFSLSQAGNLARLAAAPPEMLGFWRLAGATLILLVFAATDRKQIRLYHEFNLRNLFFTLLSGILFFLHLWSYKFAVQNTSIANSMLLFATNPLLTAAITIIFFGESLQKRLLVSYCLAMLSIYFLLRQSLRLEGKLNIGDLAALATALLYSLYFIFGKKARHAMSNVCYTLVAYGIAAVCFLGLCLYRETQLFDYPPLTWLCIGLLIVFPTLLGHALFSYLLKTLNINWMSTGKLIEPVLATTVAYFLFAEELSKWLLLSFILTSAAIFILIWPFAKKKVKTLHG